MPVRILVGVRPVAVLYAVVKSFWAAAAVASSASLPLMKLTVPEPVMVVVDVPMLPVIVFGPVMVIPAPARTAKLEADEPRSI
jgi:hypothetical protein